MTPETNRFYREPQPQIIECDQGSPEWHAARLGIPTASEYKKLLGIKKDAKDKVTRQEYMRKLAGEIISGEPMTNYVSAAMERGKAMEDDARRLYGFVHDDLELKRVGFVRNGATGCSPDCLIGEDGVLEIKTNEPHILIDYILRDRFPPEYMAQCQGALMVTGRAWVDLACYWPKMPLFVTRLQRDEAYIAELSAAVVAFNDELAEIVAKVRGYGVPKPAPVRRHWSELSLPEQAGIRCQDVEFQQWLVDGGEDVASAETAAIAVRNHCQVKSRAELGTDDAAAERWVSLNREYENWKHNP